MKRLLILLTVMALAGCKDDGSQQIPKFPDAPEELMTACPDLKNINPDTDKISDVLAIVTDNYAKYHECRLKVDAWIDWHKTQQKIMNEVKK